MGCEVVPISALKGTGINEVAEKAILTAKASKTVERVHKFDDLVEKAITEAEGKIGSDIADSQKRFFAIKLLERDAKIRDYFRTVPNVADEINALEAAFDDDVESIITNERYTYISSIIGKCAKKTRKADNMTTSDRIDSIVTNRILALPIFALVMFIVYYVSITTVGGFLTDLVFPENPLFRLPVMRT